MHTETNIVPRLRGRFEAEQNSFHEDFNPAPANAIDTFSERVNADENKGPDADTETSTYRPVANTTRRDSGMRQQPDPEPEVPSRVTFSAAKAAFRRPAAFEVTPVADNVKPANTNANNQESTTLNEPGLPGKQQTAMPYQHNFNSNSPANSVKSSEGSLMWPEPDAPENRRETASFTGKRKNTAAAENIGLGDGASSVQVNNPVQPAIGFKSLNTGVQNSINTVSPPNLSNGNLRDGGQKSFGQTAQPVIKVTIGRIEVKAVHPQAPAPVQRREPQKPMLTLDDFLSQHKRNGQ
ncbi:hypothetical protein [Mucilaginibacter flavidus]|uniref:hypothetical protein n=1 Tax=Mucilaginibacter flavidus TaxID=2949309 RepID=UPI0020935E93|nr:hypothetical protein [Mucilaginibacter flavidus]MCO5947128.1 hypothetical protein [Mucilaginibacter flavidus]